MGGIDQVTVGVIAPAVVRTAKVLGIARVISDQTNSTVLTDVVKSLYVPLSVAGQQHALWAEVEDRVIAGLPKV